MDNKAGKSSAVSHCMGRQYSISVVSLGGGSTGRAGASWLARPRRHVCSVDLFNKSIGRQSYSCPFRSTSLSYIAPVVVRRRGVRRPSLYQGAASRFFCITTFWYRTSHQLGRVVERRSFTDELSISCARPTANG